jgi:hypothetical protein
MINNHLTDFEIQEIALYKNTCLEEAAKHISTCASCKIKVEQYELIFQGIKSQVEPSFNFNLSTLVLNAIPETSQNDLSEKSIVYVISLVTIPILCSIVFLLKSSLSNLLSTISPMMIYLVITSVLSLSVFLFIEMYLKYKKQMQSLNFN